MPSSQTRALALCAALVAITLTGVALLALPSADHLGPGTKRAANLMREILPEGWSFFTKSPRDSFVIAYDHAGEEVGTAPNAQLRWSFGLNRASRLGGIDIDRILRELDEDAWHDCDSDLDVSSCSRGSTSTRVDIAEEGHSLCGDIVLARKTPTPWAFRGSDSPIEEVVTVEVMCP